MLWWYDHQDNCVCSAYHGISITTWWYCPQKTRRLPGLGEHLILSPAISASLNDGWVGPWSSKQYPPSLQQTWIPRSTWRKTETVFSNLSVSWDCEALLYCGLASVHGHQVIGDMPPHFSGRVESLRSIRTSTEPSWVSTTRTPYSVNMIYIIVLLLWLGNNPLRRWQCL